MTAQIVIISYLYMYVDMQATIVVLYYRKLSVWDTLKLRN